MVEAPANHLSTCQSSRHLPINQWCWAMMSHRVKDLIKASIQQLRIRRGSNPYSLGCKVNALATRPPCPTQSPSHLNFIIAKFFLNSSYTRLKPMCVSWGWTLWTCFEIGGLTDFRICSKWWCYLTRKITNNIAICCKFHFSIIFKIQNRIFIRHNFSERWCYLTSKVTRECPLYA